MNILKKPWKPRHGEIAVKCPVCHTRYRATRGDLLPALITDWMFYCPICKANRHIFEEEIENG